MIMQHTGLTLDRYIDSDGITCLVIYGGMGDSLALFRNLIVGLSRELCLVDFETLSHRGRLNPISLQLASVDTEDLHNLRHIKQLNGDSYVWMETRDNWREVIFMIDSLSTFQGAAHQYLSKSPMDRIQVILSKGEY